MEINLQPYRGNNSTIFTGRPQGYEVREKLNLADLDKSEEAVVFVIPEGTTSFNPSFYLGLLFESYKCLGIADFSKKYKFQIQSDNEAIKRVLTKNLQDAERSAINSLKNKTSLSYTH